MKKPLLSPFSAQYYIALSEVYEPTLSPDGQWISYTVHSYNTVLDEQQNQIFIQSTSDNEKIIPITESSAFFQHPNWCASSQAVYYLAKAKNENDDRIQLWRYDLKTSKSVQVTDIQQGLVGFRCSPSDDDVFLLILKDIDSYIDYSIPKKDRKPRPIVVDRLQFKRDFEGYLNRLRQHLYLFKLINKELIQCTFGDFDDYEPTFSPDGKKIAFASNRSDNADGNFFSSIWTLDLTATDFDKFSLTQCTDDHHENTAPTWSPCGTKIAFISADKEKAIWYATKHLAIFDLDTKKIEYPTISFDRNVSHAKYGQENDKLYFIADQGIRKVLYSLSTTTNTIEEILKGNYSVMDFAIYKAELFPLITAINEPSELYKYDEQALIKWSNLNDDLLLTLERTEVEEFHYSAEDGTALEGLVFKPSNFDEQKKYPAILWIHGGPVLHFFYGYESSHTVEPTYFAANGYVVICINPRGSSGYGQAFSEAIFADWGNKDYQDLLAGLDYVIEKGFVDENRLGVGGWSYGGIQTNFMITKNTRFKAAISGASSALSRSNYGHDQYQLLWEKEIGLPWEKPHKYKSVSSFYDVANIETPTLWIGCTDDWNVPIINTEQMYQAMKRLGKETLMVVYPGEHHTLMRPSFKNDRIERYLAWFDRFLK